MLVQCHTSIAPEHFYNHLWFSDVFGGHRNGTLDLNGLSKPRFLFQKNISDYAGFYFRIRFATLLKTKFETIVFL